MWDLDPARVAVVTPGVTRPAAPLDAEEARRRLGLPARYFLFVGALEPRKGAGVLARAYVRARRARLNADLVLVGSGRSGVVFDALQGIHRIRAADRPELEALYAGALALVMPSLAEGYGFPPLEAAACGTPSIVSDLPVFRETLGDAVLRVAARRRGGVGRGARPDGQRRRAARTPRRRGRGRDRGLHLGGGGSRRTRGPRRGGGAMTFTAVVVLHDSAPDLARLLDSLERHLPERPQLVVVDSGSRDAGPTWPASAAPRSSSSPATRDSGRRATRGSRGPRPTWWRCSIRTSSCSTPASSTSLALARERDALLVPRLLNADGSAQRSAHPLPGRARALLPALVHPPLLPAPLRLQAEPWRA